MKMRKVLLLCLYLIIVIGNISAQQISESNALEKAILFDKRATTKHLMSKAKSSSKMELAYCATGKEQKGIIENYFYVFNRGNGDGFVIISGDEKTTEVLGYSDQGSFNYEVLPDHIKSWLEGYREEIRFIKDKTVNSAASQSSTHISTNVAPLLGNILWNQDAPYNNQCPLYAPNTRSATGCVATAMAQILYYNRWPEKGNGTHSYSPSILYGTELNANFGETYYNWDLMSPTYSSTSSSEAKDAVSTLMLHCGIAVEMEYGAQSGALSKNWCYALVNYFNYDKAVSYKNRNNYGIEEWEEIIRNELDSMRPIYVTGFSSSGGHAFVCDGYDSDGFFHINWGWGGMSNGYFHLTALTPATQGIGGSDGGFNYRQSIITGIQKPQPNSIKTIELVSTETLKASLNQIAKTDKVTIKLTGKVKNEGWETVVCDFAIAAFDELETQVIEFTGEEGISIEEGVSVYGSTFADADFSSLPDGTYILWPMCKVSGSTKWEKIQNAYISNPNHLIMNVAGDIIKFTSPGIHKLSASDLKMNQKIYASILTSMTAQISNLGSTEYYGDIKVALYDKNTKKKVYEGEKYNIDLLPGATTTVNFTGAFNIEAGEYLLAVIDEDYIKLNELTPIKILPASNQEATIALDTKISFADNNHVPYNDLKLNATIKCLEGIFSGYIYGYIYTQDGTTVVGALDPQLVTLEANETAEVTFSGIFEAGIHDGNYLIYLIDGNKNTYMSPQEYAQCNFILYNPSSGIEDTALNYDDCIIYPNPAESVVNIKSKSPIDHIYIYSVIGTVIKSKECNASLSVTIDLSDVKSGQYIVTVVGKEGRETKLLIKK